MFELVVCIKRPSDGSEHRVRIPAGETLTTVGKAFQAGAERGG
jgi:hypothetical protein